MIRLIVILFWLSLTISAPAQILPKPTGHTKTIRLEPGEKWWGGAVSESHQAPYSQTPYTLNLFGENKSNQAQPLLISSHGRFVWSEQPFAFSFQNGELKIEKAYGPVQEGRAGKTLAAVYRHVSKNYFPASGKMPDKLLFTSPQWNTWIELTYNQNQADILKYARGILANGFQPGVLMRPKNTGIYTMNQKLR
jgi:alpha-glucosidase